MKCDTCNEETLDTKLCTNCWEVEYRLAKYLLSGDKAIAKATDLLESAKAWIAARRIQETDTKSTKEIADIIYGR